ncbi:MAG TPA: helix-turn-helix domain-containing protein [Methylophilaceae bacterium]|nr:helix-turn-helix domain-containing protein [Methylophilaceae bacterium]
MHPADINAALQKAKKSQAAIARSLVVSHNAVSLVIHNRTKSTRIAKAISRATGISIHKLWPGRYAKDDELKNAA